MKPNEYIVTAIFPLHHTLELLSIEERTRFYLKLPAYVSLKDYRIGSSIAVNTEKEINNENGAVNYLINKNKRLLAYDEVHVCTECDADEPVDRVSAGDESLNVCPDCRTIEPSTRRLYQLSTGELVDDETLDALEADAAAAERAAMEKLRAQRA